MYFINRNLQPSISIIIDYYRYKLQVFATKCYADYYITIYITGAPFIIFFTRPCKFYYKEWLAPLIVTGARFPLVTTGRSLYPRGRTADRARRRAYAGLRWLETTGAVTLGDPMTVPVAQQVGLLPVETGSRGV